MSRSPRTLGQELLFWSGSLIIIALCALRWAGPWMLWPVLLGGLLALAVTLIRHRLGRRDA